MRNFFFLLLGIFFSIACPAQHVPSAYPLSTYITDVNFHFNTVKTAAKGSDIWPVTWAADNTLYTAWGDGKGFSDTAKVSWGIAELDGTPEHWSGKDIFYGPEGSGKGKISGLLAIGNTLYAWKNTQNRPYPKCDIILIKSVDEGRSWTELPVKFGASGFKPVSFINFGKGYAGARDQYVYIAGFKVGEQAHNIYLARAPRSKLDQWSAYHYFSGIQRGNEPKWEKDPSLMSPIFFGREDATYFPYPVIIFNAGLKRYILSGCHGPMGKIGLFESETPWGPWKTIYYSGNWGKLTKGEYLGFEFPNKWASANGRKLGMVFSVYNSDHEQWNDACNIMLVTLTIL